MKKTRNKIVNDFRSLALEEKREALLKMALDYLFEDWLEHNRDRDLSEFME